VNVIMTIREFVVILSSAVCA